ncbi:e6e2ec79-93ae-4bde-87dc-f58c79148bf6 [Thermothielavioides terrestris]|uniref:E6e2ec79-93ae-4bde-87dc-f58c79148bf6 n=1 Tax=Thermothielavioides terrestris TaxID=2587410 RepID=A0A446B951_9PEZI|nr:e6e2ec79-93ae-4bde-87dc-f58c79148bf6 [Thermothielavioides terrestris]
MEADQPIDVYVTPRCGICSFDLLEGDRVVIGVAYNALVLDNLYSGLPGDMGCHAECLAREPCTPPPARFFSTAYNYWPRPDEVRRRERWLRTCRVAPMLHRILRRRFAVPAEVCEVIAEHCSLREWAAAVASEFWERHSATPVPEHHEFNISSSVWARRVEFEGELRYGNWVYTLIYRAGETPDRIYFDISLLGIHEIILGAPLPRVRVDLPLPQALPQLPSPRSACPSHYYYDENYYFTSATLDGVAEITPCRSDLGVIGLLLHYHDGRQAALGQVRLDKLQRPPLKVDPSRSMWLHFSVSSENCPNIEAIEFVSPTVVGPQHFPVAWRGTLEWWFSYRQCRLWHGMFSSPPTAPGKVLDYDD